ncbi:DUF2254 domain-containing protein [Rhabdothermincola salaria]|uniref:DUF2254 domain-containing protein n=1 Tax=Rhabdothermincola salaria TaxID=2903142 RepID=UPI001E526F62|nr:DUF2254 domain-containing protein [Rhabdothermincola salaria]MCD9624999.1 DUF2254 domain-containing protein [Rhabdothermincola salaria]
MSSTVAPIERRNTQRSQWVETIRSSLWVVPMGCLAVAFVLGLVSEGIDEAIAYEPEADATWWSVEDARAVITTIAPALLTFLGVVFSITIVALQLASQQYSPRLLRTFVRAPLTKFTLGIFLGTFLFALMVMLQLDAGAPGLEGELGRDPFVPVFSLLMVVLGTMGCLVVFVFYVHAIVRAMQVSVVVETIAEETRRAVVANRAATGHDEPVEVPELGPITSVVHWRRRSGVLQGVGIPPLVELAVAHDTVIELTTEIGVHVHHGLLVARLHGGTPVDPARLASAFHLGVERNLYQDPSYGLRQLVDVASKALSPAVNDPTTALQALERVEELLVLAAGREDPDGIYHDDEGVVRVVRPVATFGRLLDLGFTEIILYGASSPQISRRLVAALDAVRAAARRPDDQAAVEVLRRLLTEEVARHVPDGEWRERAMAPDRLGLG